MVLANYFVFIINNIVNLVNLIRKTEIIIIMNILHYVGVGHHCCSRQFCTVCHLFGILNKKNVISRSALASFIINHSIEDLLIVSGGQMEK